MIKVVVGGATGRLGGMICDLVSRQDDMRLVAGVVSDAGGHAGRELLPGARVYPASELEAAVHQADVYVDATSAAAAEANLLRIPPLGVNCVVATTGISDEMIKRFEGAVADSNVSAVLSPNFSVGVNVFWKMCGLLAAVLEDYDVEIIETHHDKKKDAPSGTAFKAAQIVSEVTGIDRFVYGRQGNVGARGREIGIHAVRAGDVVGEHTIIFAGNMERIELTHRASSRQTFAEGALTAIRWVSARRDGKVHSMAEVLGL
ncbi:MAG TPA: 4-hydroxy-tetrahydrodipicolinate reductase [Methanomassiliicoccales archaeon]|nr:4-hydroxy-tetrahydrodipicolinate reductase [Methanomassiliicoccales archaeon]